MLNSNFKTLFNNLKAKPLLDINILKLTFTILLTSILVMGIAGCGKNENSKRRDSLSGFENSISLGELDVEEVKPSPSPVLQIETGEHPTVEVSKPATPANLQKLNSQNELLGVDKVIPPPSIADIQKLQNKTTDVPLEIKSIGGMQKMFSLKSKIISISGDDQGKIFVADRYNVISLENDKGTKVIDSAIYTKIFNDSMPAISTISFTKSFGLWIGFTNGEIVNLHNQKWTKKVGGPSQKRFAIKKIKEISERVFIVGKGFYEWESKFDRFLSSDDLRNEIITDIAKLDEEFVVISTQSSIKTISLLTRNMKTIYNSFTGDFPIKSVNVQDEKILVGGNQGILTLSKTGYPLSRFASSIQIEKIEAFNQNSGIILDTDDQIYTYTAQKIKKIISNNKLLPQAKITAIQAIDSKSKIVVGLNDGSIYSASSNELITWSANSPDDVEPFAKAYSNACGAADELLNRKYYSRQVSTAKIDDKRYVFFNGEQVCPNASGFMRADGYTAISKSSEELELFEYNKRQLIKLPEQTSNHDISKMFIDSEDRLYLGTKRGVYIYKDEKWSRPDRNKIGSNELLDDPVTDIIEDFRGNIWLSTRTKAKANNQPPPDNYNALHLRTRNNRWADFGKANGLNTLGISSLVEDKGLLYLGSALGFYTLSPDSKIHSFSKRQGVKSFIVENLNIDSNERIWISHGFFQSGLSWIEGDTYYHTSKEQGLFSDSILNVAEDDLNRIWIMDTSGLVSVYSIDKLRAIAASSAFDRKRAFVNDFMP